MSKNKYVRRVEIIFLSLFCFLLVKPFCQDQGVKASSNVIIVRYYRLDRDYQNWTLWTWNVANKNESKAIKPTGQDKYGLVFVLTKSDYSGDKIGLLPKYGDFNGNSKGQDSPDRIYNAKMMGQQVYIVQGDPTLYNNEPDLDDLLLLHYYRFDGNYTDWTLWTWGDGKGDSKELLPCGIDKYGVMFMVYKTVYHKSEVGVLPKYLDWKTKDAPDRFYNPGMGNEVWIVQGDPVLYCCGGFPFDMITTKPPSPK